MDFKDGNLRIISIDVKKAFEKYQNPFLMKALDRKILERTYVSIIKAPAGKPIVNMMLNREKSEVIPLQLGMRSGCPLSHSHSN